MKNVMLFLLLFMTSSCHKKADQVPAVIIDDNYQCQTNAIIQFKTQNEITALFDDVIIEKLASSNAPNINGAMSNNINAYFSVRFQIGISNLADYAIDVQNTTALEKVIKSIEYSFQYQLANGDFQLVIPPNTNYPTPSEGDLASGNAFFLSSLGLALLALEESAYYNSTPNISFKNRIEILRPKIQTALNYLTTKNSVLQVYDKDAPNRLFFDAVAFYSLGKWLNDTSGRVIGLNFAQLGISKKSPKGYFLENGGWDSSYEGVGLSVGFKFLSILNSNETIKQPLWDCLSCGTNWLKSRILPSGEISTQGNTRVFPGGEQFLGTPKTVAWKSTLLSLFTMKYLSGVDEYAVIANKVLTFYQ
jgi:hypothetical protein